MDIKVKSKIKKDSKKKVKTISSGISDFSVRRNKKRSTESKEKSSSSFEEDVLFDDDDDFMFGDLQNKSKTLPDDEYMLDDNEEIGFSDDEDDDEGLEDFSDDEGLEDFSDEDDDDEDEDEELKAPREARRSREEIQMEKQRYLMKIERLTKQGFYPKRRLGLQSNLEDIKFEYECLFTERGMEKAIKEWREDIVLYAAGGEKVNVWAKKPLKLDNWSKQIYRDAQDGDFDPIFEQLHDKWGGSSMLPPELQLVKAMGMSAVRFHFSQQVAKDAPGIHDYLERNPQLRDQLYAGMHQDATKNWANSGGNSAPPSSGPGPMSMGQNRNPFPTGPPMPEQARNTNGSTKMQGPSSATEDLLKQDLSKINNDGLSFEDTILSDDGEDMNISIDNKKKGRGKGNKNLSIATIDL